MRKLSFILLLAFTAAFTTARDNDHPSRLSLSGQWGFAIDSLDVGISQRWFVDSFTDRITLPGTMDAAGYGIPNTLEPSIEKPQVLHLTRKVSYVGPAWYVREVTIPDQWGQRNIELELERVIWQTNVWVDGQEVSVGQQSLIAPHRYDLTAHLTPGKHRIAIRVDNREKYDISTGTSNMGHAYTDHTQIIWNGILGNISLQAYDNIRLEDLTVYTDVSQKTVRLQGAVANSAKASKGALTLTIREKASRKEVGHIERTLALPTGLTEFDATCSIPNARLWSEQDPSLYEVEVVVKSRKSTASDSVTFGMRQIAASKSRLMLNGQPIFLRGTLECCVFPLTGSPPTEKSEWMKVFRTAREWGLNHLRFHSWCPPRAAFEAADELGFYLQVELPVWSLTVGKDEATNRFLYAEADRILAEYGNHPSFCFLSLGNELQSDFAFMERLLKHVKSSDPRRLYTTTSFTFEPGHGDWPEANDDFFITQRTRKGWVRGQGVFNSEAPNFEKDYSASVAEMPVPVITHEIGQYAVYPDLKEIEKYTGVLDPLNFKGVREQLRRKGLLHRADDYLLASGKLAYLLYKEEIERAMKTSGISGFQLLDLHDFPGQGTALVGLLNAFWESKGIVEAAEFRQFCASTVPLASFAKAVYRNHERFEAAIEVANYGAEIPRGEVLWTLADKSGAVLQKGTLGRSDLARGTNAVGRVTCGLSEVKQAEQLRFTVSVVGTEFQNSWNIWVYPSEVAIETGDVVLTDQLTEAIEALKAGKKVFYNPPYRSCVGIQGQFVPVFWSPVHFPAQAGTMGLLLNPSHKAFAHFPTGGHSDWQWWSLATQSCTFVTDSLSENITPIVECVDNFANNRRLAPVFEARYGKGELVVCSMDLQTDQEKHPEKKQLLYSLLSYMNSEAFNPDKSITAEQLRSLVKQ